MAEELPGIERLPGINRTAEVARELERNRQVIDGNLQLMETGMAELLQDESWGGNAGTIEIDGKEYPCAGANFYADAATGQIVEFTNYPLEPDRMVGKVPGIFRVAGARMFAGSDGRLEFDKPGPRSYRIVEAYRRTGEGGSDLSDDAVSNIQAAAHLYNNRPQDT